MKYIFLILIIILSSCSPKVERITVYILNHKINPEEDSTISIHIDINTYKDFFEGRESILSFKRDYYYIKLKKIDSFFTEKDIKIQIRSWYIPDTSFYPKYGRIEIKKLSQRQIKITLNFKDALLTNLLNGSYNLDLQKIDSNNNWKETIFENHF